MPTGGGKSITFQVPALAMSGVCLVITPLIALMKDQVRNLRSRGILAHCITSDMHHDQMLAAYDNCIFGQAKFLYVSPERLKSDFFLSKLAQMDVSLLVVDEAHCISQWGYDFRPAYLQIADLRQLLPNVPVLALTATATPRVAEDIMNRLLFREHNVFKVSFARQNISYVVRHTDSKENQLIDILNNVPGSSVVYVRNRRRTREYAELLQAIGISAEFFHAGLEPQEKSKRQENWTSGKTRVIVSTNAFGMGIDKPDVRSVIHIDPPSSIEAYFQEAGRAGRDGLRSYAVLLVGEKDASMLRRHATESFPPKDEIIKIYNAVCNRFEIGVGCGAEHTESFNLEKFCLSTHRNVAQTYGALAILSRAGYMHYEPNVEFSSRLMFVVDRRQLYSVEEHYPHLSPIIKSVLRLYTGLFMEYATIDEARIGRGCALSRQDAYERLCEMDRLGFVSYNPQKKSSFVTWLCDRVEERFLVISPEVYDLRIAETKNRVEQMIHYFSQTDECRSRVMLRYFGDNEATDCGHCDVCIARKKQVAPTVPLAEIESRIIECLSNSPMLYADLAQHINVPHQDFALAVRNLISDGKVFMANNGMCSAE